MSFADQLKLQARAVKSRGHGPAAAHSAALAAASIPAGTECRQRRLVEENSLESPNNVHTIHHESLLLPSRPARSRKASLGKYIWNTAAIFSALACVALLHPQWRYPPEPDPEPESSTAEKLEQVLATQNYVITPSFRGVHDFSLGPRQRIDVGASKADLVDFSDAADDDGGTTFSGTFLCADPTVAFAAAWLSSVDTFLANKLFTEEKMRDPACMWCGAMASGYMFAHRANQAFRTVDMMDFFVHHLSYYEKVMSGNYHGNSAKCNLDGDVLPKLAAMEEGYKSRGYNNPSGKKNGKTLVVMPFFSGGPKKKNKLRDHKFLNISVLSVSHVFPNILICVATDEDYRYVTQESGLNEYFYDVMLVSGLNGTNYLPLGCNVRVKAKLAAGDTWSGFDWVFYTESDQMPHLRDVDRLLNLALPERTLIVPHRGVPYAVPSDFREPTAVGDGCGARRLKRAAAKKLNVVPDIRSQSCCFSKLYCHGNATAYQSHFDTADVELFRQYESWAMIAGTGNNFKETYQTCKMTSTRQTCPR